MTEITLYQVDAFSARPFAGNPAAVCLLKHTMPDAWMGQLAAEMNLAETAFVLREGKGWRLRWFTPAVEVALCGHATLASAHVLWESGLLQAAEEAVFATLSGRLSARKDGSWIELNFPADPPQACEAPDGLAAALGMEPAWCGRGKFDLLVEAADAPQVEGLKPDFDALSRLDARGVIVTARRDGAFDFVSRFFAPGIGIDEDPVTGSAHCTLAPYWAKKLEKSSMHAYQASRRGGELKVQLEGERVAIGGQAVTVFSGRLSEAASAFGGLPER